MPFPLIPVVAAGASLLGQGINAANQGAMNKRTIKFQREMMATQRNWALQDRDFENQYNSPQAMRARLEAAGLNPNLIYGNGTETQSASTRSTPSADWNPKAPQFDIGGAFDTGLSAYYDTQIKQATVDNMQVQKTVAEMDAMLKAAQTLNTMTGRDKTAQEIEIQNSLKQYMQDQAAANVNKTLADTKSTLDENERRAAMQQPNLVKAVEEILTMRLNRTKTELEKKHIRQQIENLKTDNRLKQLDEQLKRNGIQPGDPMWMRMINQALGGNPFKMHSLSTPADVGKTVGTGISEALKATRRKKR